MKLSENDYNGKFIVLWACCVELLANTKFFCQFPRYPEKTRETAEKYAKRGIIYSTFIGWLPRVNV